MNDHQTCVCPSKGTPGKHLWMPFDNHQVCGGVRKVTAGILLSVGLRQVVALKRSVNIHKPTTHPCQRTKGISVCVISSSIRARAGGKVHR